MQASDFRGLARACTRDEGLTRERVCHNCGFKP